MYDDNRSDPPPRRWLLYYFKVVLSLLTGGIVLTQLAGPTAGQVDPHFMRLSLILFGYTITSLIFGFGWTIPCIVTAAMWGFSGPPVRSGSQISQLGEDINRICFTPVIGLCLGLWMDLIINPPQPRSVPHRQAGENQKHDTV